MILIRGPFCIATDARQLLGRVANQTTGAFPVGRWLLVRSRRHLPRSRCRTRNARVFLTFISHQTHVTLPTAFGKFKLVAKTVAARDNGNGAGRLCGAVRFRRLTSDARSRGVFVAHETHVTLPSVRGRFELVPETGRRRRRRWFRDGCSHFWRCARNATRCVTFIVHQTRVTLPIATRNRTVTIYTSTSTCT